MLVPTTALPRGWTEQKPRQLDAYRMTICGVDLEPQPPAATGQRNWSRDAAGPYLEQHVRLYTGDTARTVIGGLHTALPTCTSYTATDARGGSSTFTVEKLTIPGAPRGTVAWRQRVPVAVPGPSTPTNTQVIQNVALVRRGSAVLFFTSYGVGQDADVTALGAALNAAIPPAPP